MLAKESERFVWHEYDMPAKILVASNGSGVNIEGRRHGERQRDTDTVARGSVDSHFND